MDTRLPRGGQTKFRQEFCEIARGLAAQGATQEQVAATLDVSSRTVRNWLTSWPEFRSAVSAGEHERDELVLLAAQARYDTFVRRRSRRRQRAIASATAPVVPPPMKGSQIT